MPKPRSRAPIVTRDAGAAAVPVRGPDLRNVIPLASGRKEGGSPRMHFMTHPARKTGIGEHLGFLLLLLGAALSVAGALAMVFTSLGPALVILAGLVLALSGNRLLAPVE